MYYQALNFCILKKNNSKFFLIIFIQAAQSFIHDYGNDLHFGRKKLFVKWQKDYFNEKSEDSDTFRPEVLDRTVFVSGFDRMVLSSLKHFLIPIKFKLA